jgi:hypothetical protein
MIKGKKFVFGIIAMVCVSVTSIILKYEGDVYIKLVGFITGLFMIGQTVVDSIKKEGK